MTIKIQGSSYRNEFVYCYFCGKKQIWMNGYPDGQGSYMPVCAKCKKENNAVGNVNNE